MGAIVISEVDANLAFTGGPWITDVFIDPEFVGLGIGRGTVAQAAALWRHKAGRHWVWRSRRTARPDGSTNGWAS